MRAMIEETTRPLQLNYPMLIDGTGHIGFRFNVEDRPTYVLIDAQGMIRRRFVGSRTEPVLAAMVEEAGRSTTEPRQPESKHK